MTTDALGAARDALDRQEWQAALDAARTATVTREGGEAERLDLVASTLWWLGRLDECIDARERSYRLYEDLGDHRQAGRCAVSLWEHHMMRIHPAVASGWLRRARRALADDPECIEYGALLLREAETAHGGGDLDGALATAQQVVDLARRLRSADLEAEALQTIGRVLIDQGDAREGMGHLDEAMLFAVEGRLGPYSTGKVYCSLISACEQVGDLDRAAEWTEATMRWAERHPFAIFPGICRVHRATVLKSRGSLVDAEREAARACEELVGSHAANGAAAYAQVGDIRRRLGDLERSEEAFDRARELCGRPCGELALLRLAQGRTDAALAVVTDCLHATAGRLARGELLPVLAQVAIAAGRLELAGDAVGELDAISADYSSPVLHASALVSRGRFELALQHHERARDELGRAVDGWQALDVPYELATTRTLLGEALRGCGDEAGAAQSFALAVRLFEEIGAQLDAQRVDGGTKASRPDGLTEREVEVLRLIAAGRTNAEIATALYLSPKTVSRHLSNIFTKIGVSSRAAATAYAFEHGLVDHRR